MATIAMTNSRRSLRQRCLRADTLTRPITATNTTAANTGSGNADSSCEKKSTTTRTNPAAMAPDSGVRAPPPSLTTDCDMPPLIGNPWPNPEARLDTPSARNSWLASSRPPCLAANVRPMAAVSTAASRKHAKARGTISFRSSQRTAGRPRSGNPCGTSPSNFTPRSSSPRACEATMPATTTNNAIGSFLRKIFPSTRTTSAVPPMVSAARLVSFRCFRKVPLFSQKLP